MASGHDVLRRRLRRQALIVPEGGRSAVGLGRAGLPVPDLSYLIVTARLDPRPVMGADCAAVPADGREA